MPAEKKSSSQPNINQPSGFLLINKPVGPTSHDIIDQLRKITGLKKIGHAGTLDPFASGLLIVAVGRPATKQLSRVAKLDKKYEADLRLGAVSNTYDREGEIKKIWPVGQPRPNLAEIKKAAQSFLGRQAQIPPMFSAKKVAGKKLYQLARAGLEIERPASQIEIYALKIISYRWPHLKIFVHCSSGTYIRSLAHDFGQKLACGAYLNALTRTAIGPYQLKEAVKIPDLDKNNWQGFLFKL